MNIDTKNNTPAFQAKIKLKSIRFEDRKKFEAVKEIFEKKTQHYAEDVLDISRIPVNGERGRFFNSVDYTVNGEDAASSIYVKDLKDAFNNLSPNDFAKTLIRIFKMGKLNEVYSSRMNNINKNLRSVFANKELNRFRVANIKPESTKALTYQKLLENNTERLEILKAKKALLEERYTIISDKIKDSPNLDFICFWAN